MHYQSRILNIDGADGFLLAIYHVDSGGEDSRQTRYARFASGRAARSGRTLSAAEACICCWRKTTGANGCGTGFMWGDGGHLYFYGSRAAMECADFSGVWVSYED